MKSLIRLGQKTVLAAGAIAGTILGLNNSPLLALPESTIIEKLSPVPMFMLINDEGQPIFATTTDEDGNESGVTGVFVSLTDAENLISVRQRESQSLLEEEQAKADTDPDLVFALEQQASLWEEANVLPLRLDNIYQFAQTEEAENITFKFLPTSAQINAALQIIEQDEFPGVPLFFLSVETPNDDGGSSVVFPPLDDGSIPVFFEVDPILDQIDSFSEQENLSINVMPLEIFIAKLLDDSLPDSEQELLSSMRLIPTQESRDLIQSLLEEEAN